MSRKGRPDLAERAFHRRRRQDAALVLPVLGIVLLISPLRGIFAKDMTILGVPLPFVYVFGLWILLIFLSWRMSHLLTRDDEDT